MTTDDTVTYKTGKNKGLQLRVKSVNDKRWHDGKLCKMVEVERIDAAGLKWSRPELKANLEVV